MTPVSRLQPGTSTKATKFFRVLALCRTIPRLGLQNVARVAAYRTMLKSRWYRWRLPVAATAKSITHSESDFFRSSSRPITPAHISDLEKAAIQSTCERLANGQILAFGRHIWNIGNPPFWNVNHGAGGAVPHPERHWSQIPDFSSEFKDVKSIWEIGRMDWAPALAMGCRLGGEQRFLHQLNIWLQSFVRQNPVNRGPHWKCAQEVSIRLIHVLNAWAIVEADTQSPVATLELQEFVATHVDRVRATLIYGIAQDNNHGVSEAAGLYIGGLWLAKYGTTSRARQRGQNAARTGHKNIENRIARLILSDGTFSQFSTVYHRLVLATLSEILLWQTRLAAPGFAVITRQRMEAACEWLAALVDASSGDAPNIGANDGANIYRWTLAEDFRDFRPAIAVLAHRLKRPDLTMGLQDPMVVWGVVAPPCKTVPYSITTPSISQNARKFAIGGFARLSAPDQRSWCCVRAAKYKFRPAHADANHLDLWFEGRNILCDGGTYSYADTSGIAAKLKSARFHNTVTFDGADQMTTFNRFLYLDWLEGEFNFDSVSNTIDSKVFWRNGCTHLRRVQPMRNGSWKITDVLEGPFEQARIFWRLCGKEWTLRGNTASMGQASLEMKTLGDAAQPALIMTPGMMSRYYSELEPCQHLVATAARINSGQLVVETDVCFWQ